MVFRIRVAPSVPRWIRDQAIYSRLALLGLAIAVIAMIVLLADRLIPTPYWAAVLAAPLMMIVIVLRFDARIRRRVADTDGLLCINCGYELRATQPATPCPECGAITKSDVMRAAWQPWSAEPESAIKKR